MPDYDAMSPAQLADQVPRSTALSTPMGVTLEERERATARARVRKEALAGSPPHAVWPAKDLEWCFAGHEDDLAELERVAQAKIADRVAQQERMRIADAINSEEKRILNQWAKDEEDEKRRRAHAEAEKIVAAREAAREAAA